MADNSRDFKQLLAHRVLIFDGAMGTSTHALDLTLDDYDGHENCPEILNVTCPERIEGIHRSFLEVGCDIVETNSFGGAKLTLAEFGLQDRTYELNLAAARIARRAADALSTPARPRFVAGSMGPGTKLITLRQTHYDQMLDSYFEQARGLLDGGADLLVIETCQDILQTKTAIQAARKACEQAGRRVPLICQVTVETTGTMLVGTDIAAALTTLDAFPDVDVIGLNCATGPQEMSEHVRYLSHNSTRPISVMPNAGLPQLVGGEAYFPLKPAELARWLLEFVETDGVSIVGGCCGTTPEHLKAVVEAIGERAPKPRSATLEPAAASIYQAVPYRQDNSFLIVGERCNTNGSRKFKQLLADGDIDGLVEVATEQVREGAHVLDVCVDYVGRDGVPDMQMVIDRFAKDVTVPLMLDSTETEVLEAGLKLAGGKCIVNSVNLEDGETRMARVCRLLRQYGAAVVALTIDEDPQEAMAKTADRKLEIATRIHELLTGKYGIREEDIFFDCLTFPITTGSTADRRLGLETLDGIAAIMQHLPRCQSILGVSNVSFGLQPAARAVLNSAFLHEARQRGLTAAIVHASKILPRNQISEERWSAAMDLIYDRSHQAGPTRDPLERFLGLFSEGEQVGQKVKLEALPVAERLKQRIIDGQKVGLEKDLDEAMERHRPLDIINKFLLDGMKVVGDLFGSGQMQLPFVLKSAETMKAAVSHLEPHMEKQEGGSRGRIVLATVRGDVHDIGKNLVDIILSNNGFTTYNLGIKQPINNIIEAYRKHDADAIGLSGLLVKSTLVMRDDLGVLNEQGITIPVILGGAALTRNYVEHDLRSIYKGPLYYAKDAFEGLQLVTQIAEETGPRSHEATKPPRTTTDDAAQLPEIEQAQTEEIALRSAAQLAEEAEQRFGLAAIDDRADEALAPAIRTPSVSERAASVAHRNAEATQTATIPRSTITHTHPVPTPPFWGDRVVERIPLKAALGYVNETMLFQVQWGFRKKGRSPEEWKKYVDANIRPTYRELVERCERENILDLKAVYGFWPCNSDGDDLVIFAPPSNSKPAGGGRAPSARVGEPAGGGRPPLREILRFSFPRQRKEPYWCLSDFWRPLDGGVADVVAFHIVTAGSRVSEVARRWFADNEYQQYLFLHGLGVETAEALAEYVHKQARSDLGVAGRDARDRQKLFKQGYQGSRFSFGYPACPRLEDQAGLMELLRPGRIGITLSDEYQLDPEQSTSAIITYHPEARYFNVR